MATPAGAPAAAAANMAQAINNVAKMNSTANAAVAAMANNAAKVATAVPPAPMAGGRRKSRRSRRNNNARVSYPPTTVRKTKGGRRGKSRKAHRKTRSRKH
jgi:hypothetical protein